VVMDEVHYLADRFRGAVWEEVIIHLPSEVQVASLSATVSNAEEFGAWLDTVRGQTDVGRACALTPGPQAAGQLATPPAPGPGGRGRAAGVRVDPPRFHRP